MRGRKTFEGEREVGFSLSFLYELTAPCYGHCRKQPIDPVIFFKRCLVGQLENIIWDRKLIEYCGLRLDLLCFLDYQLDETLPWHSTLSRTRQLLPMELLEQVFTPRSYPVRGSRYGLRSHPSGRFCASPEEKSDRRHSPL